MTETNDEAPIQPHASWAYDDTERRRLKAYANPETGSDRYFAEANRLEAQGFAAEAAAARTAGMTRYDEIKAMHPWPEA